MRDRVVALERPGIGDLQELGDDRDRISWRLRIAYPDRDLTPDGTIRIWTAVLRRFAFRARPGDIVVHPDPKTRNVSIGRITSGYRFEASPRELHVRDAEWLVTGIPRDSLSDAARQDVSQRPAFFDLKVAVQEFRDLVP